MLTSGKTPFQNGNDEDRRRWTAKLIPDIRPCIGRKFGKVNYYSTQMLSDHGYFRKYLHKIGKSASIYCLYKEGEVIGDAEHTVFECARLQGCRSVLMSIIRILRLKKRDLMAAEYVGVPA